MARLYPFVAAVVSLASLAAGADECNSTISDPITATIDNSTYFDTCAEAEEGVTFNVSTLFDVLNFTSADFILFCNSSTCLEPLHEMLHSIPTDCLINYEGSDRNLSEEVTSLHDACHKALGEEDDDDGDETTTSSIDMSGMDMSGMDMGSTSASTGGSTSGSANLVAASTVSVALAGVVVAAGLML
jgi:hypothetical protein